MQLRWRTSFTTSSEGDVEIAAGAALFGGTDCVQQFMGQSWEWPSAPIERSVEDCAGCRCCIPVQ